MLKLNLNRLARATSLVALIVGVAFVQGLGQKASAQTASANGAGNDSITPLVDPFIRSVGARYVITGSVTGRAAFENGQFTDGTPDDFVSTNLILPNVEGQVVINAVNIDVAFPYNVPGFDATLEPEQACNVINGADVDGNPITTWNQVTNASGQTGPVGLPIRRVVRNDNSIISAIIQVKFIDSVCSHIGFNIQAFDPTNGAYLGVPNPNGNEIIMNAPVDPFATGNDNNDTPDPNDPTRNPFGSYSQSLINAIADPNNAGAIGYVEVGVVNNAINKGALVNFAVNAAAIGDTSPNTIAVGPNYFVFRGTYDTQAQADHAKNVCLSVTSSDFADFASNLGYGLGADAENQSACDAIQGPQSVYGKGEWKVRQHGAGKRRTWRK